LLNRKLEAGRVVSDQDVDFMEGRFSGGLQRGSRHPTIPVFPSTISTTPGREDEAIAGEA
jgi:hypothetical protein